MMKPDNISNMVFTDIERYFPINQKLSLTRITTSDTENYPTYVKDLDDEMFFVDIPTKGGIAIPVYDGDPVEIAAVTKEGIYVGISIIQKIAKGRISGIWITYPDSLQKIQRREFMRWEFKFAFTLSAMSKGGNIDEIEVECANFSGGGIASRTISPIPRDKYLRVKLEYKDIEIDSRVKLIHVQHDSVRKRYVTGLKFLEIDKKTSDKIHKAVVASQLELRRKGLI